MKKIKEWGEVARDLPSCFRWTIGSKAWTGKSGAGVVLGSKRLLAGRDWEEKQDVLLWPRMDAQPEEPREPVPLENRLPAELVLCRLLERFREGTFRQPPVLAATYPTTYSHGNATSCVPCCPGRWPALTPCVRSRRSSTGPISRSTSCWTRRRRRRLLVPDAPLLRVTRHPEHSATCTRLA